MAKQLFWMEKKSFLNIKWVYVIKELNSEHFCISKLWKELIWYYCNQSKKQTLTEFRELRCDIRIISA